MCLALLGQTFFNLFLDNISVYIQTHNLTVCVARLWPVGQVNAKVSACHGPWCLLETRGVYMGQGYMVMYVHINPYTRSLVCPIITDSVQRPAIAYIYYLSKYRNYFQRRIFCIRRISSSSLINNAYGFGFSYRLT